MKRQRNDDNVRNNVWNDDQISALMKMTMDD